MDQNQQVGGAWTLHEEDQTEEQPYERLSDLDHACPRDYYDKIHLHGIAPQSYHPSCHNFYGENDHLLNAAETEILQQTLDLLHEAREQAVEAVVSDSHRGAFQEMVEAMEVELEAEVEF